jgi:hypothetical protein
VTATLAPPDRESPATRLRWVVTDALTVAGRDAAHWRRQPAAVLVSALFPVLLLLMFVYLLGGAGWNPVAGTVTAVRELLGAPVGSGGGWATEDALLLAVAWPVVLTAVFAVLSVRRFQSLSR